MIFGEDWRHDLGGVFGILVGGGGWQGEYSYFCVVGIVKYFLYSVLTATL